ncbi:MAG: murein biosynthesis integral membrane protein MurJ [Chitinophagales bacterium]
MPQGKVVARAAGILMAAMLVSRLLGYVRDMVIYSWFGQSWITDAYNAAFSLPDFIYALLVGGALSSAFIPVFSSYLARNEEDEAWKLASILFNFVILVMATLLTLAAIFTKPLILLMVPGLPTESITLAVILTRVMLIQSFFMALNGISLGILNSRHNFIVPAIGSILYNLGVIVVGIGLAHYWGIMAFAVGVVLGSVINFSIQLPALIKTGIKYVPSFNFRHPGFVQMLTLMVPVLVGLSVTQLNLFVNQNLASHLAEGTISALRLAQRLMMLPLGIFGTSVAMAVFPTMTTQTARGEIKQFKRTFSMGLRGIFLITIPAGVGLMALREPIISLLFLQGKFNSGDVALTAQALFFYAIGVFAYSSLQVLNRAFYALKDTITPVVSGVTSIGINIFLSTLLVRYMEHRGVALAYTLAGTVNMIALGIILRLRVGRLGGYKIMKSLAIFIGASLVMYFVTTEFVSYLDQYLSFAPKINQAVTVFSGMIVGALVYGVSVMAFRLEETSLVLEMVKRRLPGLPFKF